MIAVDANILLELIENRARVKAVRNSIGAYEQQGEKIATSALSLSHLFYLAEAHKLDLKVVEKLALAYEVYDVVAADVAWALVEYKGKDFEDALQVAAAVREKCIAFLTLDSLLAKKYYKFLNIELIV